MTCPRETIPRLGARVLVALVLALTLGVAADAHAQNEPDEEFVGPTSSFQPTLFVLGSTSGNELRTSTDSEQVSSLFVQVNLPFVFRGRRWRGGFSLRPSMRRYREDPGLDTYQGLGSAWLSGSLGKRTDLDLSVDAAYTPDLVGFDEPDLVTPRADRVRTRVQADLSHRLSRLDTLSLSAEYGLDDYPNGEFTGVQRFGASVGLLKGLSRRFAASGSVRGDHLEYELGGTADALSALAGFSYALAPRTDLDLEAGVSWITSERGADEGLVQTDEREVSFEGQLRHRGRGWVTTLRAERQLGSGVALGQATMLTRASASLGFAGSRWSVGLAGGLARNDLLADGPEPIFTESGLLLEGSRIDTSSVCADIGYALASWLSIAGSGRFAHQVSDGGDERVDVDSYRVSVGLGFRPGAPAIRPSTGAGGGADRYRRLSGLGSC